MPSPPLPPGPSTTKTRAYNDSGYSAAIASALARPASSPACCLTSAAMDAASSADSSLMPCCLVALGAAGDGGIDTALGGLSDIVRMPSDAQSVI
eukprot:1869537-Prymnesium_polylepis.2